MQVFSEKYLKNKTRHFLNIAKRHCFSIEKTMEEKETKPLLILDLDGTLVHFISRREKIEAHHEVAIEIPKEGVLCKRPYAVAFITEVAKWYDIGIWTAATKDYADIAVSTLFPTPEKVRPVFVYSRNQCKSSHFSYGEDGLWGSRNGVSMTIKPLGKLWKKYPKYKKYKTIIVDDTKETFIENPANAIHVKPWIGQVDDSELMTLYSYLKRLALDPFASMLDHHDWKNKK